MTMEVEDDLQGEEEAGGEDRSLHSFVLPGESPTLAGLLTDRLNRSPHVAFTGYTVPHPSEDRVVVQVQTVGGEVTAMDAMRGAMVAVKDMCDHVEAAVDAEMAAFEGRGGGAAAAEGVAMAADVVASTLDVEGAGEEAPPKGDKKKKGKKEKKEKKGKR